MQFTPQQLTGGARFSKQVRIGNWSEDQELEELKLKDYLHKKNQGQLLVNARQRKLEAALEAVALTEASADNSMQFGSVVMVINHKSEGFLAVNPFEDLIKDEPCRPVTTTDNSTPCVRNVFTIERANAADGFGESNSVHYGQNFVLKCNAFADMTQDSYLHSEHITPLAASKFSRKQEVCMYPNKSGKCLMQFQWVDVKQRFENEGMMVRTDAPLCIRHVHTGSFIASDKILYQNMFGSEFEVHGHNYVSSNKTQNLTSEQKGMITGDYQLRRQGLENVWSVVLGEPAPAEATAEA